jgi:hypothetical protein
MKMSKTKIAGYLMILSAVVSVAIDLLNGGDFNLMTHVDAIQAGLIGAGFIAVRIAIAKQNQK